jgi:hypothetical protein
MSQHLLGQHAVHEMDGTPGRDWRVVRVRHPSGTDSQHWRYLIKEHGETFLYDIFSGSYYPEQFGSRSITAFVRCLDPSAQNKFAYTIAVSVPSTPLEYRFSNFVCSESVDTVVTGGVFHMTEEAAMKISQKQYPTDRRPSMSMEGCKLRLLLDIKAVAS